MGDKRLFALRGATQCQNNPEDIQRQVLLMYEDLLLKNNLIEEDLVSLFFSVTADLDKKNPATALREKGMAQSLPLFTLQEAYFPGSLERVIRILIHCYLDKGSKPVHVYRNGAEVLRLDRSSKDIYAP